MRKVELANGEYYHIYNRGVDKREIFQDENDYARFIMSMVEFNSLDPIGSLYENSFKKLEGLSVKPDENLVEILCYCLNPNHYHLLLKQVEDKGIEKFMHRLSTGYTRYFNDKNKRSGSLFQGTYKAKHINSNEYLFHVSVYVNLNNKIHSLRGSLGGLASKSSYEEYERWKKIDKMGICSRELIMEEFKNFKSYDDFARRSLKGIKERKKLQKIWDEFELGG